MKNKAIALIVLGVIIIGGGYWIANTGAPSDQLVIQESDKTKVTMYKSPTCGCCVKHAAYLEGRGFEVEVVKESDMQSLKRQYNIPSVAQSCHTAVIGDYIVEGHVPVEAINKLLSERPDIDGIGLAGMPAGSPGMPGVQSGSFNIYALNDGQISDYVAL